MKKAARSILALLMCAAMLLGLGAAAFADNGVTASGECGAQGDNILWTLYADGRLVLDGSGKIKDFKTLSPNDSESGSPWHSDRFGITKVVIGEGVTHIGSFSFENCSSLRSVSIPSSLTSIGKGAFSTCGKLNEITLGKNSGSFAVVSGVLMSKDKTKLVLYPASRTGDAYTVPSTVKEICSGAFSAAQNLSSVTIPANVRKIGSYAFQYAVNLTALTIENGVKTIGKSAFVTCRKLADVTIPASVTSIEEFAFAEDAGLKSVTFNGHAPAIADHAFVSVSCKAYYPKGDKTWTADKLQDYGGELTWKAVEAEPVITAQPKDVTVAKGKTASFTVKAESATSYRWYYRTSPSGAWTKVKNNGASAKYNLTAAARHNGYRYRCEVKNASGSVFSNIAALTVVAKPKITVQPASTCVGANYSARFSVKAEGEGLSYQWYYLKTGETTWRKAQNGSATSATYVLEIAANHNCYKYKCVVSNIAGSVESKVATLTIG